MTDGTHPEPGEIVAITGLDWTPWVLITRVEPDADGAMLARFAVLDTMADDVLASVPDCRVADLEASVGDRAWRQRIAEQVDGNDAIDKRWISVARLDPLGAPGIQGCERAVPDADAGGGQA
jgi:hypothetical protein